MSKPLAWVVAALIPMIKARRQQNLRDSGVRYVNDVIRNGQMGKDMVGCIRDSFEFFGSFILSDLKPNVTVIVLMMSVPVLARQLIPRGYSTQE